MNLPFVHLSSPAVLEDVQSGGRLPFRSATLQTVVPLGDQRAPFSMPVHSARLANAMGHAGRYPTAALLKLFGDKSTAEKWYHGGRSDSKHFFFTNGALAHLHIISRTHSSSSFLFHPSLSLAPMNPTGGRLLGTESDGNGRFEDAKSHWDFYRCTASRSLNPLVYTAPSPPTHPPPFSRTSLPNKCTHFVCC